MTDSIHLNFDIRKYNELAINARMLHRHNGRLKAGSFFVLPFLGAIGLGIAAGYLFTNLPWRATALVAGYAALGYFGVSVLMGLRHRSTLATLLQGTPLRSKPFDITISNQGVDRDGRLYPWSVFTGVFVMPGLTVLQFSPAEGIPLPDKELPMGITPDGLRDKIDQWRKAAA